MLHFKIQDERLEAELDPRDDLGFMVKSSPRPYRVDWLSDHPLVEVLEGLVAEAAHPLLFIDRKVKELCFAGSERLAAVPTFEVDATEGKKGIASALELCEFLEREVATRSSTLLVVGGGVVQDVGAFAGAMYKRGVPWIYVPTTLLAQGDSCIGGKTGLNHRSTKNLLALFSAPRRVVIHTGFLNTLADEDVMSGMGEIFRLHVTGGPEFLDAYEREYARFRSGDGAAIDRLLVSSLAAKRAIVERDEFELDLRRAMNYGHSIGHAFEVLVHHAIPHGIAVTIGMLVENEISVRRGLLTQAERDRLLRAGREIIPESARSVLRNIDLNGILELLARDKKTEGGSLKLVVVEHVGQIRFIDFPLVPESVDIIRQSVNAVLAGL